MAELKRHGDRWSLIGDGLTITRMGFDWAMVLAIGSSDLKIDVRFEQPFTPTDSSGTSVRLAPEGELSAMAPALGIGRRPVERLDAFNDGRLEIGTSGGAVVRVEPSEVYEAWEISTASGLRIVSTPGGGLAVWP